MNAPHWLTPRPGYFAHELITLPWMVWRAEYRNGKWTKPPRSVRTGIKSSKTQPAPGDAGSVYEALHAIQRCRGDGVGVILPPDACGLVIVDVDVSDPWVRELVAWLDAPAELSPSGRGAHMLMRGRLPADAGTWWRLDGHAFEVYAAAAFVTVTGHHVAWTPWRIPDRTAQLAALWERCRPIVRETTRQSVRPLASDIEILERARNAANGANFSRLFDGDLEAVGGDASRADWRLCLYLAHWTNGDPAAIDRLFRQSGLYREKWDQRHSAAGLTYGQMTVTKVLQHA